MQHTTISDSCLRWLSLSLFEKRSPEFWLTWLTHNQLSVEEAFNLPRQALLDKGLTEPDCTAFKLDRKEVTQAVSWYSPPDSRVIIDIENANYPESLRQLTSPPLVLYCEGNAALLRQRQIAIVGSRKATLQGVGLARDFAAELGSVGLTVTSGLALGIDGAAHKGACATPGNTLAVMGAGLQYIHPKSHAKLARQLVDNGGCLVSEFAPGVSPRPYHFPRRNRIIAALSDGVLVVEAKIKSGSMITANLAADAGKEVFAIPGNIKHPLTEGPHYLIQQGAKLTTCVADMLEELGIELADTCDEEATRQQGLAFESASGLLAHVDTEFTSVDDLAARSGLSVSQVMADMLEYELVGKVSAVPGGYVRVS